MMGLLTAHREQTDAPDTWAAVARSGVIDPVCGNCGAKGANLQRIGRKTGICQMCHEPVTLPESKVIGTHAFEGCDEVVRELDANGGQCSRHGRVPWDMINAIDTETDGPPAEPPPAGQTKVGAAK